MIKQTLSFKIEFLEPVTPTCIQKVYVWSVITFFNNAKIILIWSMPQTLNISFLEFCFSITKSISISRITRLKQSTIILLFLLKTKFKPFFPQSFIESILFLINIWSKIKQNFQH